MLAIKNTPAHLVYGNLLWQDLQMIKFSQWDYDNYAQIMHLTNALNRNNDESETKLKANKSWKWKHILKPIWEEKDLYTGKGLTP